MFLKLEMKSIKSFKSVDKSGANRSLRPLYGIDCVIDSEYV